MRGRDGELRVIESGPRITDSANKQHYTILENKVKELEAQVDTLKHQVDRYKQIIDSLGLVEEAKGTINKFIEDETFLNCGIPSLVEKQPDLVNPIMIDQSFDLVGPFGTERIKTIKKGFKVIIDNCIPLHFKAFMILINLKSNDEIIQIAKEAMTRNTTTSKYEAKEEKLDLDSLIAVPKFGKEFVDSWCYHLPNIRKLLTGIKQDVQDMVKLRNRLFKKLKESHEYVSDAYGSYTKFDFAELSKVCMKAMNEKLINPIMLYELESKCHDDEAYQDSETAYYTDED